MVHGSTRREFLGRLGVGLPVICGLPSALSADAPQPLAMTTITAGQLEATLKDNAESPTELSGLDSLFHLVDAPNFDAFDPDTRGASAGLNFEHIISGHANAQNAFAPRKGKFRLLRAPDANSATLVREHADDPWAMSSKLQYTLTPPHYIDVDFRCVPHNASLFGTRRYAVLFFANYMNDVEQVGINFRGIEREGHTESWMHVDAPNGHRDWNHGGTYRHASADDLQYDPNHNFKLNLWSYDEPRFTKPFYYGRVAQGMTFILMLNKSWSATDEIRFSLFKFKVARFPRPAWDFQYVIRDIQPGKEYGFKARLVWKKFVSPEDCLGEYESWASNVGTD